MGFNPNQPRIPAGSTHGGEFGKGGSTPQNLTGQTAGTTQPREQTLSTPAVTLIGYHGSAERIKSFTTDRGGEDNKWGPGAYFATEKEGAENFTQNYHEGDFYVHRVKLTFNKPYYGDQRIPSHQFDEINAAAVALGKNPVPEAFRNSSARNLHSYLTTNNGYSKEVTNDILRRAGFDGVIDAGEVVAFHSGQIKITSTRKVKGG